MKNFSELFLPDFQQAQRYHAELLNQATRERFTRRADGLVISRRFSFGTRLGLLLTNLRGRKAPAARTSTFPS